PAPALAQGELAGQALLNRARAQMADADPEAAYQTLAPHEPRFAGDPAFDYLLGIAAFDSGRVTNAVFALERVLAVDPDNVLARAELARAYLVLGERETARREFETVSRRDIPEEARQAVERYLTAFRDTPEQGADFKGFLAVTIGYDTNVNAASDVESVALPAVPGVVFPVNPDAVETGDEFATIAGGVSWSVPLDDDLRLNAGVNAYQKLLESDTMFDSGSLNGYVGLDWIRGDTIYTLAAQGENYKIDYSTYRNAFGGLAQVRHIISPTSQITGYGQYLRLDYPGQDIRNADRYTVGGAVSGILAGHYSPSAFIGAFAGIEDTDDDTVEFLGYRFGGLRGGGQMQVRRDLALFGYANLEIRNYEADDPLFGERRRDTQVGARVGGEYRFAGNWSFTPAVEYVNNDSNIVIHDYDRWVVSGTVRLDLD
ncbi:MAG: tetratricopeptide repeat protein, partial [Gammaproteobacteria bacterium]|nr:tetratricopeptide repeat protein [Gammaproteobacteria bacterium]